LGADTEPRRHPTTQPAPASGTTTLPAADSITGAAGDAKTAPAPAPATSVPSPATPTDASAGATTTTTATAGLSLIDDAEGADTHAPPPPADMDEAAAVAKIVRRLLSEVMEAATAAALAAAPGQREGTGASDGTPPATASLTLSFQHDAATGGAETAQSDPDIHAPWPTPVSDNKAHVPAPTAELGKSKREDVQPSADHRADSVLVTLPHVAPAPTVLVSAAPGDLVDTQVAVSVRVPLPPPDDRSGSPSVAGSNAMVPHEGAPAVLASSVPVDHRAPLNEAVRKEEAAPVPPTASAATTSSEPTTTVTSDTKVVVAAAPSPASASAPASVSASAVDEGSARTRDGAPVPDIPRPLYQPARIKLGGGTPAVYGPPPPKVKLGAGGPPFKHAAPVPAPVPAATDTARTSVTLVTSLPSTAAIVPTDSLPGLPPPPPPGATVSVLMAPGGPAAPLPLSGQGRRLPKQPVSASSVVTPPSPTAVRIAADAGTGAAATHTQTPLPGSKAQTPLPGTKAPAKALPATVAVALPTPTSKWPANTMRELLALAVQRNCVRDDDLSALVMALERIRCPPEAAALAQRYERRWLEPAHERALTGGALVVLAAALAARWPDVPVRPDDADALELDLELGGGPALTDASFVIWEALAQSPAYPASALPTGITAPLLRPPRSPWTVPPSPLAGPSWVGRTEPLQQLAAVLAPARPRSRSAHIVVCGVAGMGKTLLALHGAEKYSARFQAGWAITGGSVEHVLLGLFAVAHDLGLLKHLGERGSDDSAGAAPVPSPTLLSAAAAAVRAELAHESRSGWLLIVDGVDTAEVASQLPSLLPAVGGCVLATSRHRVWDVNRWTTVTLGGLPTAEGVRLLGITDAADVSAPASRDAAARVVALVGGLPLALAHVRALVRRSRLGWDVVAARLETEPQRVLVQTDVAVRLPSALPSLRQPLLRMVQVAPDVRPMLRILLTLHPTGVPRELVERAYGVLTMRIVLSSSSPQPLPPSSPSSPSPPPPPSWPGSAAAAWRGRSGEAVLTDLVEAAVVDLDRMQVDVHPLMHVAMRTVVEVPAAVLAGVAQTLDALVEERKRDDPALMRLLLAQAGPLQAAMEARFGSDSVELATVIAAAASIHLYSLAQPREAIAVYERALTVWDAQRVGGHGDARKRRYLEGRATVLRRIGLAYGELGQCRRQLELTEQALALHEEAGDRDEVAATLVSLGAAHQALGEDAKARTVLEKALAMEEAAHGPDHPQVAIALSYLARVLASLGDHTQAVSLLQRSLTIVERQQGATHTATAAALARLAAALGRAGERSRQVLCLERALTIYEEVARGGAGASVSASSGIILTLLELAEAVALADDDPASSSPARNAAAGTGSSRRAPNERGNKAGLEATAAAAALHDTAARLQRQQTLLERALAAAQAGGPDSAAASHVGTVLTRMAFAAGDRGDAVRRGELLRQALQTLKKRFGGEHMSLVPVLTALAADFQRDMDWASARDLLERTLVILEDHVGPGHRDVVPVLLTLADVYRRLDDGRRQKQALERLLALQMWYYGEEHRDVAFTAYELALVNKQLEDMLTATTLIDRAVVIFEREFGRDHPHSVQARTIASSLRRSKWWKKKR
jgi:tetratricopeptide (TPR) repeat protein